MGRAGSLSKNPKAKEECPSKEKKDQRKGKGTEVCKAPKSRSVGVSRIREESIVPNDVGSR